MTCNIFDWKDQKNIRIVRFAVLLWYLQCYHIFVAEDKKLKETNWEHFFLQSLLLLIVSVSSLFPMHLGYVPHQTLITVGFKLTLWYQCWLNYWRIFRFIGLDLLMHYDALWLFTVLESVPFSLEVQPKPSRESEVLTQFILRRQILVWTV